MMSTAVEGSVDPLASVAEPTMSEADRLAHDMSTYVRRGPEPTPPLPPLPADPAARRREIELRGW